MKILRFAAVGVAATLALAACASNPSTPEPSDTGAASTPAESESSAPAPEGAEITLWLAGGDTPDALREYLKSTFEAENPGSTLNIEQQEWGDLITSLTTALPDEANTPDVVEIGNTQAPTFTTVGAFRDLSPIYEELGGSKLLQSFVDVGTVDGKQFALPYYFGSRYMFYRKDIWTEAAHGGRRHHAGRGGPQADAPWRARKVSGRRQDAGARRPLHRDQGSAGRLLDHRLRLA